MLLAGVVLAGCGQGTEPELGATAATVVSTTTSTIPPPTTTTVDFARPITQGTAVLGVDAGRTEVLALLAELRGQTDDVATQVSRLAPFPRFPTPEPAQIIDVEVMLSAPREVDEEEVHPSVAIVRFRTAEDGDGLVELIKNDLRSGVWNPAGETVSTIDGTTTTELIFREPGRPGDELELTVTVVDGPGPSTVEVRYDLLAEADEAADEEGILHLDRLLTWQDDLPLPPSAGLASVEASVVEESGRLVAHYLTPAADEGEVVAQVLARLGRAWELVGGTPDQAPTAGPLRIRHEDGTEVLIEIAAGPDGETMELLATASIDVAPLD